MRFSLLITSYVYITILKSLHSSSMPLIWFPLTFINSAFSIYHYSETFSLIIDWLTDINWIIYFYCNKILLFFNVIKAKNIGFHPIIDILSILLLWLYKWIKVWKYLVMLLRNLILNLRNIRALDMNLSRKSFDFAVIIEQIIWFDWFTVLVICKNRLWFINSIRQVVVQLFNCNLVGR